MADYAEIVAALAKQKVPPEMVDALAKTNAGLHSFGPPLMGPQARWSDKKLNAGGYTMSEGPYKGVVVIANPSNLPRENVYGHEGYHARVLDAGGMPPTKGLHPDRFLNMSKQVIGDRMREAQPPADVGGPYWGLSPSSDAEEQIASLAGYEASLPRGTSIVDTEIGRKILPNQRDRDYYFTQSSVPFGGVWEGQSEPSMLGRAKKLIADLLKKKSR